MNHLSLNNKLYIMVLFSWIYTQDISPQVVFELYTFISQGQRVNDIFLH